MYTYLDLKIVYNLITSLGPYLGYLQGLSITKPTPFSNVIDIGNKTRVFYNSTFQDFIFVDINTGDDKDYNCYWIKRKNSEYDVDLEKTRFLNIVLLEGNEDTKLYDPIYNSLDLKISEDGEVLFLKGYCIDSETEGQLLIIIIDFDTSLEKPLINSIAFKDFTFMIGDTWLYHKHNDRKIVLLSDVLYTPDKDNINNGRVYPILLNEIKDKIPYISISNENIKIDTKPNLMFGNTLTLTKDKQKVIIGINDLTTMSIHKKLDDIVTIYENMNKE